MEEPHLVDDKATFMSFSHLLDSHRLRALADMGFARPGKGHPAGIGKSRHPYPHTDRQWEDCCLLRPNCAEDLDRKKCGYVRSTVLAESIA